MTARKREPRAITIAEIEQDFTLASYWFGDKWCPAVARTGTGYAIRVLSRITVTGESRQISFSYFELNAFGVIETAPRGWAKEFKPGQIADIETWAERLATPDPTAERITFGGAR